MKENTFTVDLGSMKLTDDQRMHISNAIQSVVSTEVAKLAGRGHVALVPINKLEIGPIIQGIIARPITDKTFQGLSAGQL